MNEYATSKIISQMIELNHLGNIYGENFGTGYAGNVWDLNGLCPTIKVESGGGGRVPMIIEDFTNMGYEGVMEPIIVASRGRNPDDPSDRTTGSPTEQRLEVNMSGVSNTITTVQKDNYILEIKE